MRAQATFTGHRGPVYTLVAGASPGTFLSGSGDGLVVRWQLDRPDQGEVIVDVGQAVFALHLLPERGLLLIGTEGGRLHVVDLPTRRERQLLEVHRRGLYAFAELPAGRMASSGAEGSLCLWQPNATGSPLELLRQLPLSEEKLRGLAASPDGRWLAVCDGEGPIRLLETEHLNEPHTLPGHEGGALSAAWHPGKPVLLTGGKDGHLRGWHTGEGFRPLLALPAHEAGIYAVAFSADGTRLATAARDKTAKVWDAGTLDPLVRLDRAAGGHTHSVNALLWLGDTLVTCGDDKRIVAWK